MELFASHCRSFALLVMIITKMKLGQAIGGSMVRSSTVQLIQTADSVNLTSVSMIYEKARSAQHCGMKCSNLEAPSFYFENQTSTCYCSNHHSPDIVSENSQGEITYGYLTDEELTRPGSLSECEDVYDKGFRGEVVFQLSPTESIMCNLAALGWVVFQRRLDGSVNFHRNWAMYATGFGDGTGEFWLGLDTIHDLTKNGCELHIYMEAGGRQTGYARNSSFFVASAADSYRISVGGFSGNVGDCLTGHNGYMFSTYDVDNDISGGNCAQSYGGGWWFYSCLESNLNGAYLNGSHELFANGIVWREWMGYKYSLLGTEMAFRC